ncbi:hypothetical protein ABEY24_06300 [Peribacillus frigoritolerans]
MFFRAEEIICLFTEQGSIMVRTKQGIFESFLSLLSLPSENNE